MENKNISCDNCKYAIQHYAKLRGRLVRLFGAIHCSNGKIQKNQFEKYYREKTVCGYWQGDEERSAKEQTDIIKLLIQISERLADIILILNEESESGLHSSAD